MGPIGIPEMLFILVIALLIFGPKRLPEMGRTIGKALGEFRRATTDLKRSIDVEMRTPEPSSRVAPAMTAPRPEVAQDPSPDLVQDTAERESDGGDGGDAEAASTDDRADGSNSSDPREAAN